MFPANYYGPRFFPVRYWTKTGSTPVPWQPVDTGGQEVWAAVGNGGAEDWQDVPKGGTEKWL